MVQRRAKQIDAYERITAEQGQVAVRAHWNTNVGLILANLVGGRGVVPLRMLVLKRPTRRALSMSRRACGMPRRPG
jgi:hypothetical protein